MSGAAETALTDALASMKDWERNTLLVVLRRFADLPFDAQQLTAAAAYSGMTAAEATAGLEMLQARGVLSEAADGPREPRKLELPAHMLAAWQRLLLPKRHPATLLPEGAEPEFSAAAGAALGLEHGLLELLGRIGLEGGTAPPEEGRMPRKLAKQLEGCMAPYNDAYAAAASLAELDDAAAAQSQPDAGLLLALAGELALLVAGKRLELRERPLIAWLHQPHPTLRVQAYAAWKRIAAPRSAEARHMLAALEALPALGWNRWENLLRWMQHYGMINGNGTELPSAHATGILCQLAGFGWLELGRDSAAVWLRTTGALTEDGAAAAIPAAAGATSRAELYVQPDLEIIASANVSFAVQWELMGLAERATADVVSVYKLTQASAARAADNGRDAETAIAFLQQHAKYGVPEAAAAELRRWMRQAGERARDGKGRLQQAAASCLLLCADARTAAAVAGHPKLRMCLSGKSGQLAFVVLRDQAENLILNIAQAGLSYRCRVEWSDMPSNRLYPRVFDTTIGNREQASSRNPKPPDLEIPVPAPRDPERLYPGFGRIPQAWFALCRSYHASTRRRMVEQALAWRTRVKLGAGERQWIVTPLRIEQEESGGWSIVGQLRDGGGQPIELRQEQWECMQIMLPGINE
ncbi:helicase-associated domain-containing protein [Paenibacillus cymbidii]|uniref:helicase-associated domain-containing protein n=1 Tax=Paenibacillus cymbidii TaxID=1639034 RepID=UPI0010809787|nr:helicase-associated domain-containing protein [Paenibacillus cymbidii]